MASEYFGFAMQSLADVMDIRGGAQPPANTFKSDPEPGYTRFVQIRDFETDAHLTYIKHGSKWRYCSESDVMIARYGASVGRICRGVSGAYNVALVKVVPKNADIDFLYHLLRSHFFQGPIAAISGRSAQAGFNKSDLASIRVPVPPIGEQRLIAAILNPLDDRIKILRQTNITLESIAQALFKSWFVDFDPVRAKADGLTPVGMDADTAALFSSKFKESALGPIPKGWTIDPFTTQFDFTMGQSPPGSTYNTEKIGLPFFQGCTDFGDVFPSERIYCSEPTRFAQAGDVLMSVRAPVGALNIATYKCSIGRGVCGVRHRSGSTGLTYLFLKACVARIETAAGEGALFRSLSKQQLTDLPVVTPDARVVSSFIDAIEPLIDRMQCAAEQVIRLSAIRDTLLPRLISGKLRLPETETLIEDAVA